MKVRCAWCQTILVQGPPEPVSDGICPNCNAIVRAEAGLPTLNRQEA